MMGRMVSTLSLTRLQKYSLFQKYKARSATCKSKDIKNVRRRRAPKEYAPGNEDWRQI